MKNKHPEDSVLFGNEEIVKLKKASKNLNYLLLENYNKKTSLNFICNKFLFKERQRVAMSRAILKPNDIKIIKKNEIKNINNINHVFVDGFNVLILLECIISDIPILKCNDGIYRDMASLKGNYKISEETNKSIILFLNWLDEKNIKKATIYLDEPVSNSKNLKNLIIKLSESFKVKIDIELRYDVDKNLYEKENVITGDSIILINAKSWINVANLIEKMNYTNIINFI